MIFEISILYLLATIIKAQIVEQTIMSFDIVASNLLYYLSFLFLDGQWWLRNAYIAEKNLKLIVVHKNFAVILIDKHIDI